MQKIIFFTFALFVLLSQTQAQTTLSKTMTFGGISRAYRVYIPASYQVGTAAPLVLNLHGYTSNNQQQEFYGDFRAIADTAGFILVHPNGTADASNNLFWNAGFSPTAPDDTNFLLALVDTIARNYTINPKRIYSTGMSNGGIMSYYLACRTNRFAAIASVTGSMTRPNYAACMPTKPTPIMEIHGTADATVPYANSGTFVGIDSVVRYWAGINGCSLTPTVTNIPNSVLTDGATAIRSVYSGGANGRTVEHYKIVNGAHTWPGAPVTIGVTCMDFSASKEIWRFFNQHRLVATDAATENQLDMRISPNPVSDILTINSTDYLNANLSIFDLQGKMVGKDRFDGTNHVFNTANLPKGLYILQIQNEKGHFNAKFVKI